MKNLLRNSYNKDAENFDNKFKELQYKKYERLNLKKRLEHSKDVLDLGSGSGLLYDFLNEKDLLKNFSFLGVDFSDRLTEISSSKSCTTVQGDICDLPFKSEVFDTVLSITVLRIIPDYERDILLEANRVLKPGGAFIVTILQNRDGKSFKDNLRGSGFKILNAFECGQDIAYICSKE